MVKGGGWDILKQLVFPGNKSVANAPEAVNSPDFAAKSNPIPADLASEQQKMIQAAKQRKPVANRPRQERLKLPPETVRLVYGEFASTAPTNSVAEQQLVHDFGESAFRQIQKKSNALETFQADHRAPDSVGDATAADVARAVSFCAANLNEIVDPDADAYVGYDFGTSTTKAVVRWPNRPRSPAKAIDVPDDWCGGGVPHTWPTVVFLDAQTMTFHLLPAEGRVKLEGFKAALISNEGNRIACSPQVTKLEAAVAFLAMHIAYVIGSIASDDGGKVSLVNVAVPVASLADGAGKRLFDHAVKAALTLLQVADRLTLDDVRSALAKPAADAVEYELHAELSGVIAGYSHGPRHHNGPHMVIDCGSATLDIASFRLEAKSDWPVGLYAAEVQLLGADSCTAYVQAGADWATCSQAARFEEHLVYSRTLGINRIGFAETAERKLSYQIILAGGGIDNTAMKSMLERWQEAFDLPFHRPKLHEALEYRQECPASRLILADGLANDPINIRKVSLPVQPAPPPVNPRAHDWTSN